MQCSVRLSQHLSYFLFLLLWAAALSPNNRTISHTKAVTTNSPLEGRQWGMQLPKCLIEPGIRIHTRRSWLNVPYKYEMLVIACF